MNDLNLMNFALALLPVLWLIFSLCVLKMPAYRASIFAFIGTVVIAIFYFKMSFTHTSQASLEGILLALFPIIWIILSALFLYNISLETGNMEIIKSMLSSLSPDRRVQGLIIAFAFGGFLEAVAGFGTAVAIPAGILVTMGFQPFLAAAVCLVANTVPVAFGVLGVPITTLAQVTSLPLSSLAFYTAVQLIPFAVILPFALVLLITGSIKKIKGVAVLSLAAGIAFSLCQTLTAVFVGPELAALCGSILSLLVIILMQRILPIKEVFLFPDDVSEERVHRAPVRAYGTLKAFSPYILVLIIVFAEKIIPRLDFLYKYPFAVTQQFYFGTGGSPMTFQLATSAGTVLFISAILGGAIQGASLKQLSGSLKKTVIQIRLTVLTVILIVALSKIMGYSGMTSSISNTLANICGAYYPFTAPFLGALGTFITGSDTSSNILFGNLQKQTALQLGMNQEWLAAANASGATLGKMISPQSIAIVSSATDLSNQEGKVMQKTMKYCLVLIILMGLFIYAFCP